MDREAWVMYTLSAAMLAEKRGQFRLVEALQDLALTVARSPTFQGNNFEALCQRIERIIKNKVLVVN